MDSANIINANIVTLYKHWRTEIETKTPYLFSENFSNIFCPGVLEEWPRATMRILVVGEEATWRSRSNYHYSENAELPECQNWIINDLKSQLDGTAKKHKSPFWRRIRAIQKAFPQAVFCWTNIDSINADTRRALAETDRKALHDCETRLVRKLVELIEPTHIVFFGWHDTSLCHEFPELCNVVYPLKFGNTQYMKQNGYIVKAEYRRIPVVFTYHPSWRKANNNAYIERIVQSLEATS